MSYTFVFFSYKSLVVHNRTILAVLSLIGNYQLANQDKILIYTDNTEYLNSYLNDIQNVEYIYIGESDVNTMMGQSDLIHRVKIGIIEKTFDKYDTNTILYADSDTFFIADITKILNSISIGNSIMHKFEFSFVDVQTQTEMDITKDYCNLFNENGFDFGDETIHIKPDFSSWNAGIIGLHYQNKHWLKPVYQLTDQTYAKVRHHACEQFAFSYVLQTKGNLSDFEQYNKHYWHSIEKKIADKFLSEKLTNDFAKLSLNQKKEQIKKYCNHLLKLFPNHEYTHRYNAMIAFQEKKYAKGYKESILTLLKNPFQNISFFKDVAYYTKKMILNQ